MERKPAGGEILRALLLEDNQVDASLSTRKLRASGFEVHADICRSSREFKERSRSQLYDIILGDYRLPDWTALDAIRWLRSTGVATPFVLVTGTLGDELAIECLKAGADDYVLKDNLERLPIAVRRTIAEHKLRQERDRGEIELRKAEEHYRLLFNASPHPMWVFDTKTLKFLAVNNAAVQHYGYSLGEFYAMTLNDIGPAEQVDRLLGAVEHQRQKDSAESYGELRKHRTKDGTIIDVEISSQPIRFQEADAQLVLAHDVTERRKLEQQFRQAQKMEAIGRLAGGVSHDFNNLLMVISGYAQLVEEHPEDAHKVAEYAAQIIATVRRASGLTKQLLAFSRKQIQDLRVLDLNALVNEFCKMLPTLVGDDVVMSVHTGSQECLIYSDKAQIEQIIMNLIVNACDAMPTGGGLTIEAGTLHLDRTYFAAHNVEPQPGDYAMLAVSDTGAGMDSATRAKIFDPFFTTKEPGKGTGLGLSTVYGIVKQSKGYIWAYSEVGRGTTFKVYFPKVNAAVEPEPAPVEEIETGGTETILLVEDEAALRAATCEFLESKGYHVLPASDGIEALRISATHNGEISLILTDLVMPGLTGTELARQIAAERPAIQVIYMSGYADNAVTTQGLDPSTPYLQKPFGLVTLTTTARRLLDQRKPRATSPKSVSL
jgi:two-component system cell cycle sensor histidine kinase/response regulator CckA